MVISPTRLMRGMWGRIVLTYTLEDGQGGSDMADVTWTLNSTGGGDDDYFVGTAAIETFDGGAAV